MEILTIIFLWPFLILAAGLVFVAFFDIFPVGPIGLNFSWIFAILLLFIVLFRGRKNKPGKPVSELEQLAKLRRFVIIFSISLLVPIFMRYLVLSFNESLVVVIIGLVISFGLISLGIFSKRGRVLMYSNIIGGAFALFYLYSQLWGLGDLPRIIAAGFGLLVAVVISVIKLKDKLT